MITMGDFALPMTNTVKILFNLPPRSLAYLLTKRLNYFNIINNVFKSKIN